MGPRRPAPVQIRGTYDTADGTWLWGWDHPSVQPPLDEHARKLKAYGQEHGIAPLTTRKLSCTEADAWDFARAGPPPAQRRPGRLSRPFRTDACVHDLWDSDSQQTFRRALRWAIDWTGKSARTTDHWNFHESFLLPSGLPLSRRARFGARQEGRKAGSNQASKSVTSSPTTSRKCCFPSPCCAEKSMISMWIGLNINERSYALQWQHHIAPRGHEL